MTETPPQSGSGRKEQPKSKAAIRNCTHSFAQRVQSAYCQASDGGVEGVRPPRAFSHRFFAQKSGVAEGRCLQSSPQSGSGRKEQTKSKAAPSIAGSILHSACSRSFVENRRWQVKGAALALSWGFKGVILYGRE